MAVIKQIYTDVVAKLQLLKTAKVIKHIAVWNNQISNEGKEDAFNFPAVFLEFSEVTWLETKFVGIQTNVSPQQKGVTILTVRIAYHSLKDETEIFTNVLDLIDAVRIALNGTEGTNYSPLLRSAERHDINHDNVSVWEIDFTCAISEGGESQELIDVTEGGTVDITLELNIDLDIDNYIIRTGDGETGN